MAGDISQKPRGPAGVRHVPLSPQQDTHSVSPFQLQPQAQSWPPLTPLSPSSLALAPPSHPLPAVPSPRDCQLSAWQDSCQEPGSKQQDGENSELVSHRTPEQVLDHFKPMYQPRTPRFAWEMGVGKGVSARFQSLPGTLNLPSASHSGSGLWVPVLASEIRPFDQRPCQSMSSSSDLVSTTNQQMDQRCRPQCRSQGAHGKTQVRMQKQSQISGEKQGDRKGRQRHRDWQCERGRNC